MSQLDFASISGAFVYNSPVLVRQVAETAPAALATRTAPVVGSILPEMLQQVYDEFIATLSEAAIRRMNGRLERGLTSAKSGRVFFTDDRGIFAVQSSTNHCELTYYVNLNDKTCTCPDSQFHNACKHRFAAWLVQECLDRTSPEVIEASEVIAPPVEEDSPLATIPAADHVHEAVIYAVARLDESVNGVDDAIPVEIVEMGDNHVVVRALPELINGELRPRYPFPSPFEGSDVKWSSAMLPKEFISDVKIYR